MFIEILFWKSGREAQEIQDGYTDLRSSGTSGKKKKSDWTKDEDEELGLLVELYRDSPEEGIAHINCVWCKLEYYLRLKSMINLHCSEKSTKTS